MDLKYADQIHCIESCPPSGAASCALTGFRFVHKDIDHVNNYRPPAIIKPGRPYPSVEEECGALALSFFSTIEFAKAEFARLMAFNRNIGKKIGDQIASVAITPADGLATAPEHDGHFNLFEARDCNFAGRLATHGGAV